MKFIFAAFGLGTMIYNGLELGTFFEIPWNSPCYQVLRGINPILQMIFTFSQMYFVFMNARVSKKWKNILCIIYTYLSHNKRLSASIQMNIYSSTFTSLSVLHDLDWFILWQPIFAFGFVQCLKKATRTLQSTEWIADKESQKITWYSVSKQWMNHLIKLLESFSYRSRTE